MSKQPWYCTWLDNTAAFLDKVGFEGIAKRMELASIRLFWKSKGIDV